MKRQTQHLIILCTVVTVAAIMASCSTNAGRGGRRKPQPSDSLYTEAAAMVFYDTLPERSLQLIDSAEIVGNLTDFRASLLRAQVYSYSSVLQRQDTVQQICRMLLQHDSVQANASCRQSVLEVLVNASRMRHDDEQWMHWAVQLADLLREQGYETEALRTEAEIGLVLTHLGQDSTGMDKIDGCIRELSSVRRFNELDASIIAMKRKINALSEMGRHADVLPVAQAIEDRLADYQAHPDAYHDGSYREPENEESRAEYIDFYGAQATAFKAAAYAEVGDASNARLALDAFARTRYGRSLDGRKMVAPTEGRLGDYEGMLSTYDEVERQLMEKGDTLRADYADMLRARAGVAEAQGRLSASLSYHRRYEELSRALWQRLLHSQAQQYAARYQTQQQQMEIERREAEATRNGLVALAATIGLLAALAFAVYFFVQKRLTSRKNRILVEQITEAIEYKRKYEERASSSMDAQAAPAQETADEPTVEKVAPDPQDPGSLTDEQLFQYISEVILRERLYLNPVCDRQTIIERFGLTEKRVGKAFSKGSTYKSLPSFIRNCRLEYACQLLRQHPEMTIGNVAIASGFSNHTRFTADFKQRYSVSPTEFRSLS